MEERALFGEISRDLGERWRMTAGGRWFGYRIETGSLTEFPYTPMYNSPFTDFASDDRGVLFKASVSYRFDDQTNAYVTRSEGYRIGGGNNFRVCTDQEIALLTDADPGNDPPQSGCIYEDQGAHQAPTRPPTTSWGCADPGATDGSRQAARCSTWTGRTSKWRARRPSARSRSR